MPSTFLKVDPVTKARLDAALEKLKKTSMDASKPLRAFDVEWKFDTQLDLLQIRAPGGEYRGETWAGMKPQYTRKTDNVTVPAWGGVKKVRGQGMVKGKRRPSNTHVAITSIMNKDTGDTYRKLYSSPPMILDGMTLIIGSDLPEHAEYLFLTLDRNPVKFFPEDEIAFHKIANEWLDEITREFNR